MDISTIRSRASRGVASALLGGTERRSSGARKPKKPKDEHLENNREASTCAPDAPEVWGAIAAMIEAGDGLETIKASDAYARWVDAGAPVPTGCPFDRAHARRNERRLLPAARGGGGEPIRPARFWARPRLVPRGLCTTVRLRIASAVQVNGVWHEQETVRTVLVGPDTAAELADQQRARVEDLTGIDLGMGNMAQAVHSALDRGGLDWRSR